MPAGMQKKTARGEENESDSSTSRLTQSGNAQKRNAVRKGRCDRGSEGSLWNQENSVYRGVARARIRRAICDRGYSVRSRYAKSA